ncbi:hypothetical protein L1887_40377 [Cichorium endivia]|nr:hypothetical protein L1887_40377 [Cichorium endivia]
MPKSANRVSNWDDYEKESCSVNLYTEKNLLGTLQITQIFEEFISLSWSVSKSRSASKQLEAIGSNNVIQKSNNILALAVTQGTMSCSIDQLGLQFHTSFTLSSVPLASVLHLSSYILVGITKAGRD